jgi:hypothetical protein
LVLTSAEVDALDALADVQVSIATAEALGRVLTGHINEARRL